MGGHIPHKVHIAFRFIDQGDVPWGMMLMTESRTADRIEAEVQDSDVRDSFELLGREFAWRKASENGKRCGSCGFLSHSLSLINQSQICRSIAFFRENSRWVLGSTTDKLDDWTFTLRDKDLVREVIWTEIYLATASGR